MPVGNRFNEAALAPAADARNAHKIELIRLLYRYQRMNMLSVTELGEAGGIAQSTLSKLFGGNLGHASTDKLLAVFTRLGVQIDLLVNLNPPEDWDARVQVRIAEAGPSTGPAQAVVADNDEADGP